MKKSTKLIGGAVLAMLFVSAAGLQAQTQLLHPTTTQWNYLSQTTDPGLPAEWNTASFDDSSWAIGSALFGNETQYPYPVATAITGPSGGGPLTSYFRTKFTWNGTTTGVVLTGTNYIDDGDVVYLNGVEITRFNMPAGPPTYATTAPVANPGGYPNVNNGEPVLVIMQIPLDTMTNGNANPLVQGENVLAVEIHNQGTGSSDTAFAMSLYGQQLVAPCTDGIEPTNRTVIACRDTTFSVVLPSNCGIPTPTIEWYRNVGAGDELIAGQTGTTLTLTNVLLGDSGEYFARLSNPGGSVDSRRAQLTVEPDTEPPVVVGVINVDASTVTLTFDEPIDPASISLFDTVVAPIADPTAQMGILSVQAVSANQVQVVTDQPRDPGLLYFVSISLLADVCGGNTIPSPGTSNQIPIAVQFQQGVNGYAGTHDTDVRSTEADTTHGANVQNLSDNNAPFAHALLRFDDIFGTNPGQIPFGATISSARLVFYTANNSPHTHGLYRMLIPWDESVTWNSMVNGVDQAGVEFLEPPDAQFVNQNTVGLYNTNDVTASLAAWAEGANNFGWALRPIGGDDGYQFASSEAAAVEQRPLLIVDYIVVARPIAIVQQPTSINANERDTVTFNVVITGSEPQFQWYKNGEIIPGATGPSYTIQSATPADNGSYTVTINNNIPSSATSDPAVLNVAPDAVRPTALSAKGGPEGSTTIQVAFSEALNQASAEAVSNYQLLGSGGITIQSAALSGSTVTLTLSGPRVSGENYNLQINDVTDTAATPNAIDPNPTILPVSTLFELVSINTHSWKYLEQTVLDAAPPCLDETPWTLPGYDDSGWATGFGVFFGDRTNSVNQPNPNPVALPLVLDGTSVLTILNLFTNASNVHQENTYYFRTKFNYPSGATNGTSLLLHAMVDDGAVFYLNGNRIYDLRVTNNPASCTNFTAGGANGGQTWEPALTNRGQIIGLEGLVAGENTLAVQLHQVNDTSSDINLGVLLEAEVESFGAVAPRLSYSFDATSATLTFTWTATDYVLVESTSLSGPWDQISPTSPASVSTASGTRFYQLRKP